MPWFNASWNLADIENDDLKPSNDHHFKCNKCGFILYETFPSTIDADEIISKKTGLCGEWTNLFTGFCVALGYEARLCMSLADNGWTEVYLPFQ